VNLVFAFLVIQPILIGMAAQMGFKRTGIAWVLIALGLDIGGLLFWEMTVRTFPLSRDDLELIRSIYGQIAMVLMTFVPIAILLLIVLATLPRRRNEIVLPVAPPPIPSEILPPPHYYPAERPPDHPRLPPMPWNEWNWPSGDQVRLFVAIFILGFGAIFVISAILK
jgi:hypothetical protein